MITQERLETRHFEVAANPTLILNNETGPIHVHAGPSGNEVFIQATKHSGLLGSPNDIRVSYTQNTEANTITVNVDRQSHFFDWDKVTFDVVVPSTAKLQLKTDTGSIDVSGVSGEMVLSCISGSIEVRDGTVSGQTQLITATGSVTFNGAIERSGSYRFETTSGSVTVTLPSESVFHVEASTMTGSLRTNFPGVTVQHLIGHQAIGDVGSSPQATISLRTVTGSIQLYQR
jgi:DUF4097 and DUF4098 domain-containing protein YvlB